MPKIVWLRDESVKVFLTSMRGGSNPLWRAIDEGLGRWQYSRTKNNAQNM